ncbi:MAG: type IV pilus secretin PilQ, partial [Arenicella sp.]
VSSIDTFQNGNDVRMIVSPSGEYQQISFQNDNVFTIILEPIPEGEEKEVAEVDENGYSGERLSLNFQRLEVRSALSVISDFTGLNIIASDDVQGELTLNLKDVPWDQALDVILEAKGYAKRQKGNVIWVAPAARIAEFEREQLRAAQSSAELEPLVTEIIRINYARAEELKEVLESGQEDDRDSDVDNDRGGSSRQVIFVQGANGTESISSTRDSGRKEAVLKITSDERTNSLLVTTTSANMEVIKQLIRELDQPVRQVMVETRIVEATDTFSRELGAKLGFTRLTENARGLGSGSNVGNTAVSGSLGTANATQQSLINGGDVFNSGSAPGGLNVDLGANGINGAAPASYAFSLFRAGTGFANIINLELSALEAEGRGKIVSSPRLVTSGQRAAAITTGTTRFVTVGVSTTGVPIVETRDAFLALTVNPQISPDDNVIMDVLINQDFFLSPTEIRRNNIVTQVT